MWSSQLVPGLCFLVLQSESLTGKLGKSATLYHRSQDSAGKKEAKAHFRADKPCERYAL